MMIDISSSYTTTTATEFGVGELDTIEGTV
jgi:hypothetical protein